MTTSGYGPAAPPNYGLNPEIIDSYRRTVEFNNSLLMQQFLQRYNFRTSEEVRKMRSGYRYTPPRSEREIANYGQRRADNYEKRRLVYEKKLASNVEPSVRNYALSIGRLITGEEFQVGEQQ